LDKAQIEAVEETVKALTQKETASTQKTPNMKVGTIPPPPELPIIEEANKFLDDSYDFSILPPR